MASSGASPEPAVVESGEGNAGAGAGVGAGASAGAGSGTSRRASRRRRDHVSSGIELHNAGVRVDVTTSQSWFDEALGVFILLRSGSFYVLNPDHGNAKPVLLLQTNVHASVLCVRVSLDSRWLAVQVSDTQIALYDLAADGMSRGTCTLIVSCRNQRRNSIMRNGVLWTDHAPEQLPSGIYGSEDMQTLVLVTQQGIETFNILPGMASARLARHISLTVSRFWYLPAERFLALATGRKGTVLRSYMLLEGPPLRLPKVQLPSAVSHSSVFICCLYKELFIGVLQGGWLSLREVTRERVRQARSYELQQLNLSSEAGEAQVRVQVVDNLVVVHDLRTRKTAAVDIRFRHGNGAAARACCVSDHASGDDSKTSKWDTYDSVNVFLRRGLILNPHTGELRRLHFALPALVQWSNSPVIRVDIMLRRRPVGKHGETLREDDGSTDDAANAVEEAAATEEGRYDSRLLYPNPKALVLWELQKLAVDPVPMGQLSTCFDVINKQFRYAFGINYKRPVRPSSGLPRAPPAPKRTSGVAAMRAPRKLGPPRTSAERMAATDRDHLPAFRRVTSQDTLAASSPPAAAAAAASSGQARDTYSSDEGDSVAAQWDVVPGVSALRDAACPADAELPPEKRRGMGVFAAAMDLTEDEYNIHGTLLVMPEDVHEHVFAPLVEAVLSRAATSRRKVDHGAFTVNTVEPTCAQTAAALMDYFRSLQMYMVPVTWELHMLLVKLLLGCEQLGLLHQLLQYHILHDSMPVALTLIKQGRGHPALVQVALDMMRRLKQYTPMVEALLKCGELFAAMREVRRHPQLVSKSLIRNFFDATVAEARERRLAGKPFMDLFWSLHAFLICWIPSVVKKKSRRGTATDAHPPPSRKLSFGTINTKGIPELVDDDDGSDSGQHDTPPSTAADAGSAHTRAAAAGASDLRRESYGSSRGSVMSAPGGGQGIDGRRISKPELRALWMQQAGSRTRTMSPPLDSGSDYGHRDSDVSASSQGVAGAGAGAGAGAARDDTPQPGSDSWAVDSPSDTASGRGSDAGSASGDGGGGGGHSSGLLMAAATAAAAAAASGEAAGPVIRCSSLAHAVGAFPDDLFDGEDGARGENQQVRDLFGFPSW